MSKPKDYTDGPTPVRIEEVYQVQERYALATNKTTPVYWDLQTNLREKIKKFNNKDLPATCCSLENKHNATLVL